MTVLKFSLTAQRHIKLEANFVSITRNIQPLGTILFVSKAWRGRVSSINIVKGSDLINPYLHYHGYQILVDRGFTLQDEFTAGRGVELLIPNFRKGKKELNAKEVEVFR